MGDNSAIEWTDATWNPVTGCTETSPGCDHCYAKTFAERWRGVPGHAYTQGFDLQLRPERLDQPLRWRKPRRIFVNSMSDLFHKDVPDSYIDLVFGVMAAAHWHTFQVLTKRAKRLARYFAAGEDALLARWAAAASAVTGSPCAAGVVEDRAWPLPNVQNGVSIESARYTWRADYLRQVDAAVRFVSAEPLLSALPSLDLTGIHWLIVGGESGPGARPAHPVGVRDLRDRAVAARVAFFFKQWGAYAPSETPTATAVCVNGDGCAGPGAPHPAGAAWVRRVGKGAAGNVLDGRVWQEVPQ